MASIPLVPQNCNYARRFNSRRIQHGCARGNRAFWKKGMLLEPFHRFRVFSFCYLLEANETNRARLKHWCRSTNAMRDTYLLVKSRFQKPSRLWKCRIRGSLFSNSIRVYTILPTILSIQVVGSPQRHLVLTFWRRLFTVPMHLWILTYTRIYLQLCSSCSCSISKYIFIYIYLEI